VTHLLGVSPGEILNQNQYAIRWAVELPIKELEWGLHMGRMQESQEADRVERSIVWPVCAYLLLIHLYGREQSSNFTFEAKGLTDRQPHATDLLV
jgi:hypothetical protein